MKKVEKLKKSCKGCGKILLLYPSAYKNRIFCSLDCKGKWQKVNMISYWRGKKIPYYPRPNRNVKGELNGRWKGGRRVDKDGYILIWIPDHPYSDYHGYVREHRLVVEKSIGRKLFPKEVIHHKDANKQNNRIENLELYNNGGEHIKYHVRKNPERYVRRSKNKT